MKPLTTLPVIRRALALSFLIAGPLPPWAASAQERDAPWLWGELEPGPHAVGLRVTELAPEDAGESDPTRPFANGVRLFTWYPALAGETVEEALTLADLYRLQEDQPPAPAEIAGWLREDTAAGLDGETLDFVLSSPFAAVHDRAPASGAFPLVLFGARHGVPTAQAALVEFLASHGWVVGFAWPMGPTPPMPWEGHERAVLTRTLESYAALLDGSLDLHLALPFVDPDFVAAVAWSYGGESVFDLQARREEIDLVVSLSATTVSGWLFADRPGPAPGDLRVPLAYITQRSARVGGSSDPRPSLLELAPRGAWVVSFDGIAHSNFSFLEGMVPGVLEIQRATEWSVGGEDARFGYESIARATLEALEHRENLPPVDSKWSDSLPPDCAEIERLAPRGD